MTIRSAFAIALLTAVAIGCAGTPVPRASAVHPGQVLFNGYTRAEIDCFRCHDGSGRGTFRGPSLAERTQRKSDDELFQAIHDGPGRMPAFKGKLEDAEMAAIVAWLREAFPTGAGSR